jgi:hypothetical protein
MLCSGWRLGLVMPEQWVAGHLQACRFLHQVQLVLLAAAQQRPCCRLCRTVLCLLCAWQR